MADAGPGTRRVFVTTVVVVAVVGLALLAWRDTGAMALLLAVHLGFVMGLFLTLFYLFIRVLPMISIFELRTLTPPAHAKEDAHHG